jgi:L-seryl-tRNA(Ser) seleniumtransferase
METARVRLIPSIEQLRQSSPGQALEASYGREAAVDALRAEAAALRAEFSANGAADTGITAEDVIALLIERATARLTRTLRSRLEPVINASGVIIHTNLGRAPLCESALSRVIAIGAGYATLEYDRDRGSRGRRDVHAEPLLCQLTGAEAAIVVNNNAAAVLLMLTALAAGREVIISRGELVEIGGGFRVPDVMRQSGALLREVGTTNRTRIADYGAAVSDRTALILRVHPSNFVIQGFTERPRLEELTALGRQLKVPVVEDLGSGYLETGEVTPMLDEPTVQASLRAGIDVVTFSGDKLLGGPQAGIIAGRRALIDTLRKHPLMRALRVDKLTYAALEATLGEYSHQRAATTVPVQRMLSLSPADLEKRAEALAASVKSASVIPGESAIGGGSAPGLRLPTSLVSLNVEGLSPDALLTKLRGSTPPIIARIDNDRVVLDLRTVAPEHDDAIANVLRQLTD